MSSGAVLQLAAYGTQDLFLTGNPQITYFKAVIKRYTNFAMEVSENYFDGKVAPGQRVSCKLERIGDLIHEVYLRIELPEIQSLNGVDNVYTSWVNAIGYAIINRVEIQIGNRVIDRHYGQWMNIWSELSTNVSKKPVLNEMIGKKEFFTTTSQNGPLELFIPLQFWFCRNIGSALPLVAIQRQDIFINIEFNPFEKLWTSNIPSVACEIIDNDIEFESATLLINYIFLDCDERRYFAQNKHYYLIEQLQIITQSIEEVKEENIIDMSSFNHPVQELIWVLQGVNVQLAKQWTNYSGEIKTLENPVPSPPMIDAIIRFEGLERFERRTEKYFRLVVPYEYHTFTPVNNYIYVYSFSTDPEALQPTGTVNMSRIDHPSLHLRASNSIAKSDITVYARSYNILRIIDGITGVMFAN